MTLTLRWRALPRRLTTRWRGPAGTLAALTRDPQTVVAAIIGPPGPSGSGPGGALRLDAPLAAVWNLDHPLGRVPAVQVFLATGEPVLADVSADAARITVTFAAPQQGFVLVF